MAPDGTPRFAASHLRLFCLHMSHKKDIRVIWVNQDTGIHPHAERSMEIAIMSYCKREIMKRGRFTNWLVRPCHFPKRSKICAVLPVIFSFI